MVDEAKTVGLSATPEHREKPTRARFFILFFLLVATIVNYIDRANLSIAMPFLSKEFGFDKVQIGYLFGAWGLTYAFALVPGGYIADLFGSRISYAVALVSWSIATVFQGFVNGYNALFGARLAVGFLESPAFPANARAVAMWFPMRERGFATSVYVTGQYIGTPLFTGLLIWIASSFGWRYVFYVTGTAGILLGLTWYFIYQDPKISKRANAAELRYIEEGGGLVQNAERTKFNWRAFFELLTYRQILAICLGKFCNNTVLVFFGTWFIPFLVEERKMTMIKTGFYQALPYLGATAGILLAGFFADLFIRRGYSMSAARKAPLVIGTLLAASIVLVNVVGSDEAVIAILTIAFFGQGVASSSWAAVSEVAPKQYIGLTSGITSLAANLAGISTPIIIGYVLQATGSFYWALNFIGILALCGALSYSVLLGRLDRIVIEPSPKV